MQKMFDEHNRDYSRDRAKLMGNSEISAWRSHNEELIDVQPVNQSIDAMRADQRKMLEGIF